MRRFMFLFLCLVCSCDGCEASMPCDVDDGGDEFACVGEEVR